MIIWSTVVTTIRLKTKKMDKPRAQEIKLLNRKYSLSNPKSVKKLKKCNSLSVPAPNSFSDQIAGLTWREFALTFIIFCQLLTPHHRLPPFAWLQWLTLLGDAIYSNRKSNVFPLTDEQSLRQEWKQKQRVAARSQFEHVKEKQWRWA